MTLAQVKLVFDTPTHLNSKFDHKTKATWIKMNPVGRPVFSRKLLSEIIDAQTCTIDLDYDFIVLTSENDGVFNYGGDLDLFVNLISNNDREGLVNYMELCLNALHNSAIREKNIHRVAVVNGTALGGGFEAALCCDHIIAEQSAKFGFPESLFNLFPGMGAYSYLVRRTTPSLAKKIILSGKRYSASELYELGVIDQIVPDGRGHDSCREYMNRYKRLKNGFNAIHSLHDFVEPLNWSELHNVGMKWVDTALSLTKRDMKLMTKLSRHQA